MVSWRSNLHSNFVLLFTFFFFLNVFSVKKILNPVALIRSASSRSSSSRFVVNSSSLAKEEGEESSSNDFSEECMLSGSHQSTLDRLYAWEKKLYDEVKVHILLSFVKNICVCLIKIVDSSVPT